MTSVIESIALHSGLVSCELSRALLRARRVGGSLVLRIPKEVVEEEGIREGDLVEIEVSKARNDWFGTFPNLKRFSREEELDAHV